MSLCILIGLTSFILTSYLPTPIQTNPKGLTVLHEFIFNDAPFPSCHASTIEETPAGLVAAWFGGTNESNEDVEIWVSRNVDGKWTPPVAVANGIQHEDKRYPTWNPVLFQAPNGLLYLYFKVGPNPSGWWGMASTSADHGKTWADPVRLPEDILGPIKNKPILLDDGTLINPSSSEHSGWRVHLETSKDLGKSWKIIQLPETDMTAIQPSLLIYPNNKLQMLARSKEGYLVSSWSEDGGKIWDKLKQTNLPNPNSGTDAVTLDNGWQLLVYNHAVKGEELWGGKRSPLNVAVSKDGANWKSLTILEDEPGEFSYPAVIQGKDGKVHITYTWNREKIKYVMLDIEKVKFEKLKDIKDGKWLD